MDEKITISKKGLVQFMMETWNDAIKKLTIEEIDLKYVNHHYELMEKRFELIEKEIHLLKKKLNRIGDITSA